MIDSKQLRYFRLRQAHPDMSPSDAMDLAEQQLADSAEPAAAVPPIGQGKPVAPAAGGMAPEELHPYEAPLSPPPLVQASGRPAEKAPVIDEGANEAELAAAKERDRKSHLTAGMELATRQLVAGLTRTNVPQGIGARPDEEPGVLKEQGVRRQALHDYLARKHQEGMDTSTTALHDSEIAKNYAEAMKAKLGKGDDGPESLRTLLLSPVYAGALAKKGMSPDAVKGLGEAGLKDLVAQLKTDTTNDATVQAGRESAGINASRGLSNAKDLKVFESNMPKPIPSEMIDQIAGLNGSGAALSQFEQNLGKTEGTAGKIGASGLPGASMGIFGAGAEQGATFEGDRKRTAIALARGLEGGMARPGNVEIIEQIMPHATDSDAVKATKMAEVRKFIDSKRSALDQAMKQGNYKNLPAPTPAASAVPKAAPVAQDSDEVIATAVKNGVKWVKRRKSGWVTDEVN